MRRFLYLTAIVCIAISSFRVDAFALFKSTEFTALVVSEEGEPISGVRVGVGFEKNTGWGTDSSGQAGISGSDGKLTFSGQSNGHITYGGSKKGYYPSYYDYDFKDLGVLGWKPWNPELKIVMRKIENPVPMYVRDSKMAKKSIAIPVVGRKVGFDLIAYDWVAPYGSGQHSDFIFFMERRFSSMKDYEGKLTITFPTNYDGIIKIDENLNNGSEFKLPRYASEKGYKNQLTIMTSQDPNGNWVEGYRFTDNYIFRIRSEVRGGKLIRAMYGKIRGPIQIEPRIDPSEIYFRYYVNPDYTRNLEFDPKQNLFGNLPDLEQVREP